MAIVGEQIESRRIQQNAESPSAELVYWAVAPLGEDDAINSVLGVAPLLYRGLIRQGATAAAVAPALYDVSVQYGPRKPRESGDSSFAFDVSTTTVHVTQSLSTIARYAIPGRDAHDFGGAIGVSTDGTIEGVDVLAPQFAYTEEHTLPNNLVTPEYVGRLHRATGKINDANFKHFRPYECLFLGASGRKNTDEQWRVTFSFLGSPTLEGIQVGDIVGIKKDGWDVLWVLYEEAVQDGLLVKRPVEAFVEQVYLPFDFSELGIGT